VAEGGALLRRYTGKTRIEGSNPSLSAIIFIAEPGRQGPGSHYRDTVFSLSVIRRRQLCGTNRLLIALPQ
jgi:hypothetical protein